MGKYLHIRILVKVERLPKESEEDGRSCLPWLSIRLAMCAASSSAINPAVVFARRGLDISCPTPQNVFTFVTRVKAHGAHSFIKRPRLFSGWSPYAAELPPLSSVSIATFWQSEYGRNSLAIHCLLAVSVTSSITVFNSLVAVRKFVKIFFSQVEKCT